MARIDEAPDERDQQLLRLSQLEDCPACETLQDVEFVAQEGIYELEDLVEAPTTEVQCVHCENTWLSTFTGWVIHEDAG